MTGKGITLERHSLYSNNVPLTYFPSDSRDGILQWPREKVPSVFCESQNPIDSDPPLSLRKASLAERKIMLEQANCTDIRMEVLSCEYHSTVGLSKVGSKMLDSPTI